MLSESEVIERVESAYASERFEPTFEEVIARAGRQARLFRAGWMLPLGAAVAAAAVIVGFFAVAGLIKRPDAAEQAAAWDRAFAEACARNWADQARHNPALTPQHQETGLASDQDFSFRDGELGLRLYILEPVMFACSRDEGGQVSGKITGNSRIGEPFLFDHPDKPITYAVELDPSGGPEYLYGRVPAGADRITVRTASGDELPATIRGAFFAAWAPRGGLGSARVSAYQGSQQVASGQPVYLRGTIDDDILAEVCDEHVRQAIRDLPHPLPAGEGDQPPLRFTLRDGGWSIRLYASNRIATSCYLAPDGSPASGGVGYSYDDATQQWSTLAPFFSIAQFGDRSWIFGYAPTDTQRAEMVLTDGTVLPTECTGGFFAITWMGTQEGNIAKYRFHTSTGVIEHPYSGAVGTAG